MEGKILDNRSVLTYYKHIGRGWSPTTKAAQRQEIKMKTLTFNNGTVSVGDVFVSSWGYEQTNVNFYQVISVHGKKTVTVHV